MKKISLILSVAVGILIYQSASAVPLKIEQFVGYNDGRLGDAGVGSENLWSNAKPETTVTNAFGTLSLTNLNGVKYLVQAEGALARANSNRTTGFGPRLQFAASGQFPPAVSVNIYTSFLLRFNDANDVDAAGEKISECNRVGAGSTSGIYWELQAMNTNGSGSLQLGINKFGASLTNWANTNITAGQTVFVVIRQKNFSNETLNVVEPTVYDLWINPPTNSLGTNEANLPPASVTVSNGTDQTSGTGPSIFWLPSGANNDVDEIRMGTNWADVTPWFGQCVSPNIISGPTNKTVVEGARAIFHLSFVVATSPTFQWQRSTNSGTTWTDIADADLQQYETPNLALANNGNQYRIVVTAGCSGAKATSAVATVTVNAAGVGTPNGVIVDDNFDDTFPGDPPFTSVNSVWFATVSTELDAPLGDMIATTAAGTSSVWVGHFVNTTNPVSQPVSLNVGKRLKVTLPFTASNVKSNSGGTSLRMGLFDYADRFPGGGTNNYLPGDGFNGNANGFNNRGYMLTIHMSTNFFDDNSPLAIYARNIIESQNLLGTTSDFNQLDAGPAVPGGLTNRTAFISGTNYVLEYSVTRQSSNAVIVTASITGNGIGGGTNLTLSVLDTNWLYYRFDAFAIRPASAEATADSFTIPQFKVEVEDAVIPSPGFLSIRKVGTNIVVTWTNSSFRLQETTNGLVRGPFTDVGGAGNFSPYTNDIGDTATYYRLVYP